MHQFLVAGDSCQQVDGHHAFSCAGAAFHNKYLLLSLCNRTVYELKRGFENNLLIIDEREFLVAIEQSHHRIGQGFARTDFAVVDHLHDVLRIAIFHKPFDEIGQGSHIALEENGRFVDMGLVEGQGEGGAVFAVVEEGAGRKLYLVFLYRAIEVREEVGVGPSLVGGVADFTVVAAHEGSHHGVFGGGFGFAPLLELNDHGVGLLLLVEAGEDEIDPFRCLRDLTFDGDHGIARNFCHFEHIFHVLHGVFPAVDFAFRGAVIELLLKLLVDDVIDVALADIGHEGFTILLVNDHRSVYLVALPLALSAGYFRAFCVIFFSTISSTLRL